MSNTSDFVKEIGALSVGATAFALGDPSGGTLLATPITALAALGLTLKLGCADNACAKAEKQILKQLKKNPEYTSEEIDRARTILKSAPKLASLDPKALVKDTHGKDFEETISQAVLPTLAIGSDDTGVRKIIETALLAGIAVCKNDPDFRAALTLEFVIETARKHDIDIAGINTKLDAQTEMLQELLRRTGGLDRAVAQAESLSIDELKTLALAFEETSLNEKPALIDFLTKKAADYNALKAEVDAIDDGLKRLSNLKAAAADAIARVDLDEVEELLSRVQEVELEEAAKTAELRANNALLRGNVDQAYQLLSAAADSFAAIDPRQPVLRRHRYTQRMYFHGMRFGGAGMELAAKMIEVALSLTREKTVDWASCKNSIAISLQEQGNRTGGETGTRLLAEAVNAFRDALTIYNETDHPADWATTQNNLGIALQKQGTRTGGEDGKRLLAKAVTANRDALTVRTKTDHPEQWATTQNNLGIALQKQGTATGGEDGTRLLAEAVTAYRDAVTVYSKTDHPVEWAMIQHNLGIALQNQGTRTGGQDGTCLLAEAIAAYSDALTILTKPDHPVGWAETQKNLALAEEAIADHDTTKDPHPHLEAALDHIEAALTVYDPEHMSYRFEQATRIRERLKERLKKRP